ncbi:hypothetical protein OH807_29685 [Kitasatospora sp. NBC_01560]|uniref:hypothetical protein n=1 Tax=Kitasatospora sp. NBC_01560 TaxID=2975965 RepID=UPI00386CE567
MPPKSTSTRRARLFAAPLLASALGLAGLAPVATAAPAAPAGTADTGAALPELVVPGQPLPTPHTDELLAAGDKGFLHAQRDGNFAWTAYDTGATQVVASDFYAANRTTAKYGAGSDTAVAYTYPNSAETSWKLKDMTTGAVTILQTADQRFAEGLFGSSMLVSTSVPTAPGASTLKLGSLAFLRPSGADTTVIVPLDWAMAGGLPERVRVLGGDAKQAFLGYNDSAGRFHVALADTVTGELNVSLPTAPTDPAVSSCVGPAALGRDRVAWMANDCSVHVLSRKPLKLDGEIVLPFTAQTRPTSIGLTDNWLITAFWPGTTDYSSAKPPQKELRAQSLVGGPPVTLLPYASPTLVQAPDGSVLAEGGQDSGDWKVRKVLPSGEALPSVLTTGHTVAPDPHTVRDISLAAGVLTTTETGSGPVDGYYQQNVTLGRQPATTPRLSLGAEAGFTEAAYNCRYDVPCARQMGTGDGRVVHLDTYIDPVARYAEKALFIRTGKDVRVVRPAGGMSNLGGLIEAAGRYVLIRNGAEGTSRGVIDIDSANPGAVIAGTIGIQAATIDAGALYAATAKQGEIAVTDLATRQQTRTVQTGATSDLTTVMAAHGWLYWSSASGAAGVINLTTGATVPVRAGALSMGAGYLFYEYSPTANRSTLVTFETGTAVTRELPLRLVDYPSQVNWSADRFGGGFVYRDSAQNLHVVSVTAADHGSTFNSVSPVRLLDTREGIGRPGSTKVAGRDTVPLQIAGRAGVPLGAKAVALNITATETDGNGMITAWASGAPRPNASNLNWTPGQTIPNLVVVPVGVDGKVNLFNGSGAPAHLIADVFGYYTDNVSGSTYNTVSPERVLDTREAIGRPGTGKVGGREAFALQITGRAGVPAGAKAVVLNITATETDGSGMVTAWAGGAPQPATSNLNWTPGQTIPNLVVVPVGADGKVNLFNGSGAPAHLIADVFGYYTDNASGATYSPVSPDRLLDTREGVGRPGTGKVAGRDTVPLQIAGRAGVPAGAKAVVLNITVTETDGSGMLIAWAGGAALPTSSNLNWTPNLTIANLVVVPVGADGKVNLLNGSGAPAHLIADVFGYYS